MSKRSATSSLTKDNWDKEEKPEEMGMYQKASPNELKMRSIKKAKRRGCAGSEEGPSVFKNFKAFGAPEPDNSTPTFSFLSSTGNKPTLVSPKNFPAFSFNKASDKVQADEEKKSLPSFGTPTLSSSTNPMISSNDDKKEAEADGKDSSLKQPFKFGIDNSKMSNTSTSISSTFNFNPTNTSTNNSKSESSTFKFGINSSGHKDGDSDKPQFKLGMQPSSNLSSEKVATGNAPKTQIDTKEKKNVNGVKSNEPIKSSLFLANLKALNYGVLNWVKKHIEKNQYINLTPIFEDYKKHFEDIKKNYDKDEGKETKNPEKPEDKNPKSTLNSLSSSEPQAKTTTPLFSFGSANSSISKPGGFTFGPTENKTSANNEFPKGNTKTEVKPFSFGLNNTSFKSSPTSSNEPAKKTSTFTFGGSEKPTFSFGSGNSDNKPSFTFGSSDNNKTSEFSFGSKDSTASSGFTFEKNDTSSKGGFSFSQTASDSNKAEEKHKDDNEEENEEEESKIEIKEDDAVYEKKVKLFYKKKDKYVDRGIGTLFLKPVGEKTQLLVRAMTNLGNILLNIILNESIPTQRVGKNNVLLVCVPNPPINTALNTPVSMLIRVKTESDADELLEKIDEHKN